VNSTVVVIFAAVCIVAGLIIGWQNGQEE